jgi:hypothetical protein
LSSAPLFSAIQLLSFFALSTAARIIRLSFSCIWITYTKTLFNKEKTSSLLLVRPEAMQVEKKLK